MEISESSSTHYRPAMPETEKNIFEDFFSSVLLQFKKCLPSENPKLNSLGILRTLKLRNLVGEILPISLKLNFTPSTLGCNGLIELSQVC